MLHFLFSPEPVSAAALIASTILPTRVHVHARERRYPPILVSISCLQQQGGGLRVWRRFYFCIKKKSIKDLKIYQSCCSRWSKQGVDLMSGGGSSPAEDRISMRGPITISHTSENNTLFFPLCRRTFSTSHPRRHGYYPRTVGWNTNRCTFRGGKRWKGGAAALQTTEYKGNSAG